MDDISILALINDTSKKISLTDLGIQQSFTSVLNLKLWLLAMVLFCFFLFVVFAVSFTNWA